MIEENYETLTQDDPGQIRSWDLARENLRPSSGRPACNPTEGPDQAGDGPQV
jgi:hypothetical protein